MVLASALAVTAGGGWLASTLETNDQFVQYFDHSIAFRRDADFTMKNLSGIYRLELQVGAGGASRIADPEYLSKLDELAGWLRAQPEVEHVYSVADVVKRVNRAMNGDAPAAYAIPSTHDAASQALLLYEMGLPQGIDLTDRVSVDRSTARMTVTVKDLSSRQMNDLSARAARWLRDNAPPPMWSEATGPVVIFSQLGDRNARSMVQGDFVSLALISLCMIVVLRSFKLGLLSIVPNVVPIVIGYGLWRIFVGQMNIVASVAASISLGIIVDDTIHFLTKYKATLEEDGTASAEEAMRRTLVHVGPAMIGTSVILVLGFGVLTFSSFQMTSYLGWLSVLIVSVAPLADLVLAPALVSLVSSRPRSSVSLFDPSRWHMKRLAFFSGLFLLVSAGVADAKTPEEEGQRLAMELAARNAGYKDLGGEIEMTLKDAGGGEAKRRFTLKVLEKPDPSSGDYSLIVFQSPADVKNTACCRTPASAKTPSSGCTSRR
jgi:predicted RND superfamily exporter protein